MFHSLAAEGVGLLIILQISK